MVEINNSIKQVILFFLKELDKNGIKPEKFIFLAPLENKIKINIVILI